MNCFKFILCLVTVLPMSHGVKVDMQGSLSLGKDVVESLTHLMRMNGLNGRRSLSADRESVGANTDIVSLIVNSAFLCRDLDFCKDDVGIVVNEYIIALTKAIEGIFDGLVEDKTTKDNDNKPLIFEEELKSLLQDVKQFLKNANDKADNIDAYTWLNIIKKISAKFHDRAFKFASQRLEGSPHEVKEVRKMLTQKLTIAMTLAELKFENRLCSEHNVCTKTYECTKALNALLERIEHLSEERVKEFVRYFYETLPGTGFYYRISDVTTNEFQSILNDMAYSETIPTKNVLSMVHKSVKDRLDFVKRNIDSTNGRDVKLVNVILSDMDHFYNDQKEPFQDFLSSFIEWTNKGGRFSSPLRRVMNDIQKMLTFESDDLTLKLENEVKVFLEITVDPVT